MQPTLSLHLQEATQSFIENLLASEAFVLYGRACAGLRADVEARSLLDHLSQAQALLRQKQTNGGDVTQDDVSTVRELQQEVQRNRVIMEYVHHQQEAVSLLCETNTEISQLLGINFASFANHATC